MWKLLKKTKPPQSEKNRILFIYPHNPRNKIYVEPLFEKLKGLNIFAVDVNRGSSILNINVLREKAKDDKINHLLLEDYVSLRDCLKVRVKKYKMARLWRSVKKMDDFKKIESQISLYFNIRARDHMRSIVAIDNIVESVKPRIAVTPVETSEFDKGLFLACQKRGVPCIGIQHGLIKDLRCVHDKDEISLKKVSPDYCPIPTKTAVFGENDKEFLIKHGNYPAESVVVTGNQRDDRMFNEKSRYNKESICKKLALNPKRKIIVFATDPDIKKEKSINLIKTISNSINNNIQFLIKVHPGESEEIYRKIVKNNNINAIITKHDVYEVLYICDALLNVKSAIGLETTIMDTPIITLNFSGKVPDYIDYTEKGVGLEAKNREELKKVINLVLYDEKTKQKLKEARGSYVYEHCYKIDGKASERIANLINSI
ncbi:CDP-glycerol glycerophosphotransferase family protein [Candidatus Woesearchaeota archaeon]|nr:CDP-glycerol glycerophosphotransferase family protein [Candidatus Woesearchaeota archaeon]